MGRVIRVVSVRLAGAILLLVAVVRPAGADWEDGLVLGEQPVPDSAATLLPDAGGEVSSNLRFPAGPDEPIQSGSDLVAGPGDPSAGPPEPGGRWYPVPAGGGNPCPPEFAACHGGQCCHANWTLRADALLLWRADPGRRPIYSRVVPDTEDLGGTALDANNLTSDVLAAPRLSLLRTNCDGQTFEATYLYAGMFYAEKTLPFAANGYATAPPGIYGNEWGPPDTSLDSATAQLLGQLQSVEFNTRHCIWANTCQFLIGTRWLQWNETLQMKDFFSYTSPGLVTGSDFYETRCFNNLWGGQIGLDTLLLGSPGMTRIEGLVKAGAYYNAAGQATTFRYRQSDGFAYQNQARANEPAACSFVGEVGLTAAIPIACNWDFRCGYFGLWLTGLAQPTRQLSNQTINQFDSKAGLDTAGATWLQGLSLGLEGRW